MPPSIAAAWPSPGRFALALVFGLAVTLAVASAWGEALIETVLPVSRTLLGWIDDRFGILFLGVEHNWQDTVVRLRVNILQLFVMGGKVIGESPKGWLEVTTTTGAMLQPLVIGPAIAFALPGALHTRIAAFALAALLAFGFLLVDLPVTLHAYVWDMFIDNLDPDRFSPLMVWHEFLHAGGRLGVAVILGLAGWRLARKAA
ncbi:MAG: hypothetical protein B7Z32_13815 [Hydrogenophilales bacterium 12-64-13]|uniref:hypothetical protein n=1 Tax=Thiobacillus denitrificans TaxID=36861 RepID=UPI00037B5FCD|nr:hypothetical protein [Thiobacillus denitrificans]OYW62885.1 MAG: hypothetical protein B7Z32_13815 [Hydrogenophilales bacterium 12-64-13]